MPPPNPQPPPLATRMESADEIRQALEARRAQMKGKKPAGPGPQPAAPAVPAVPEATPERPTQRPPMGLLCVLDDGRLEGEWVRIRGDHFVLGRVEGDVVIPHDGLMSGRHAEIVRQKTQTGYRWVLQDLESTNGTWVRVGDTLLRHLNEFVVGRGRYRFESAGQAPTVDLPAQPSDGSTRAWHADAVQGLLPSLVEVTPAGLGPRVMLTGGEYWIGRDRTCGIARPDDQFLSPRHARLHRDNRGQWHVENHKSVNGVWLRVSDIPLSGNCQFRLGEQRFLFRTL